MICIDVSGEFIEVIVAKKSSKSINILSSRSLSIPEGFFRSDSEIDFNIFERCLSEMLVGISDRNVVLTFSFAPTIYSAVALYKEKNNRQQRTAVESQVFSNISAEEYYVDYYMQTATTNSDGKNTFIAYAQKKSLVDNSKKMLSRLGKTAKALIPSQYAAHLFINRYFSNKTVAVVRLSQKDITLHLLNPPQNIITRNTRLMQGDITSLSDALEGSRATLIQDLEKLNSYQSIKFPGRQIDDIVLFGNNKDPNTAKAVRESLGIPCHLLSDIIKSFSDSEAVYTVGALLAEATHNINFFEVSDKTKNTKATKRFNVPLVVSSIVIAVNILIIGTAYAVDSNLNSMVEQRQGALNSPQVLQQIENFSVLRESLVSKLKSEGEFNSLNAKLKTLSEFNKETYYTLIDNSPEGVIVINVSYINGTYNINCIGQNEQQAADYVMAVTKLNIFKSVDYYGFSDNGAEVVFTITGEVADE